MAAVGLHWLKAEQAVELTLQAARVTLDRGVGEIRSSSSDRTGIFQECLEGWREHGIASFDRVLRVTDQMREAN